MPDVTVDACGNQVFAFAFVNEGPPGVEQIKPQENNRVANQV
jgi:hypothetical protein